MSYWLGILHNKYIEGQPSYTLERKDIFNKNETTKNYWRSIIASESSQTKNEMFIKIVPHQNLKRGKDLVFRLCLKKFKRKIRFVVSVLHGVVVYFSGTLILNINILSGVETFPSHLPGLFYVLIMCIRHTRSQGCWNGIR